jgi:hypothetical protein
MCADLTNLAEASWHTRHEDIVQSIQRLRCPEAVPALERTAHALYEYLNYDEFFGLARKCTWALADIGTREAYAALERLAKSSNSQIARHAKKRLEHWRDELVRKPNDAATLWRPVGPKELRLIQESGMRAFPPRLPEQPIFYPVLSEDYAVKIARDWNVPSEGEGYVTRFRVLNSYLAQYSPQVAGGRAHLEYWIPSNDLGAFNKAIIAPIEVIAEFR